MKEYKYTYQDWLEGKIESIDLEKLCNDGDLSKSDLSSIQVVQEPAFHSRVKQGVEALKRLFLLAYNYSFVKDDLLNRQIEAAEASVQRIKTKKQAIYLGAIRRKDGRYELTSKQAIHYLSFEMNDDNWGDNLPEILKAYSDENTPFAYILKANHLKWLYWFKNQQNLDTTEPTINLSYKCRDDTLVKFENAILKSKPTSYDWLTLPDTQLPRLYQLLIDKQLIHPDTTFGQLNAVFTANPLEDIQPVKWIGAKNLLAYFIDRIQNSGKTSDPNIWSIAEKCFTKSKDLVKSRNNYERLNKNSKPNNYQKVDQILEDL